MDMEPFFKPSVFLRLQRDEAASVSLLSLFNYIMRRNAMLQTVSSFLLASHRCEIILESDSAILYRVSVSS